METHVQKEHWLTVYNWLKQCGSGPNQHYCREEITTHPDYPSLLSAVDFLDGGGMAYQAVRADASYINEFNYPLLAHIKEPGNEYMHIVPNAAAWDQQKEITQHWSGIVVYPEKDAVWRSSNNDQYQKAEKRNKFIAVALVAFGLLLFAFSSYHVLHFTPLEDGGGIWNFPIWNFLFGAFSFVGLAISLYALGTELGFQNQVVKQVCGAVGGSGGCELVLKSKYAKGAAGITPADASVLYFASQFCIYLLACFMPQLLPTILWLSLGGIVVAAFSIYAQAVLLKQWCALCLGIVAVLVLQAAIAVPSLRSFGAVIVSIGFLPEHGNLPGAIAFCFLLFAFSLLLLPIKSLIKTNTANKTKLAELKKWKLDADLFINQWQQEQEVDTTIWENDLLLGNPNAPLIITVACNPYCGPCAKAHEKLDKMLRRFDGKLKVLVRFLCQPENETSKMTIAVKAILQKTATFKNNFELEAVLTDWFAWMDYDKWVEKWQPDGLINVGPMLEQHHQWTEQSAIAFTPTFFLNGKKMPGRYSLDDLALLLPHLAEMMKEKII